MATHVNPKVKTFRWNGYKNYEAELDGTFAHFSESELDHKINMWLEQNSCIIHSLHFTKSDYAIFVTILYTPEK